MGRSHGLRLRLPLVSLKTISHGWEPGIFWADARTRGSCDRDSPIARMPGAGRLGPGGRCAVLVKLQSMAGDVRGHDLGSWWRNRIAYRDDVRLSVDQWRMTSATFAHAAAGAPPAAVAAPPDEPFASVTQAGNAM